MRQVYAFPQIPENAEEVRRIFGDIREFIRNDGTLIPEWEAQHIVRVNLPEPVPYAYGPQSISKIAVHAKLRSVWTALLVRIWEENLEGVLGPYGGGFEFRANRNNPDALSLHSYGLATDWNPVAFPNKSNKKRDPKLVSIFEHFGFMCGQDFKGTKDPMHFQFARNV